MQNVCKVFDDALAFWKTWHAKEELIPVLVFPGAGLKPGTQNKNSFQSMLFQVQFENLAPKTRTHSSPCFPKGRLKTWHAKQELVPVHLPSPCFPRGRKR